MTGFLMQKSPKWWGLDGKTPQMAFFWMVKLQIVVFWMLKSPSGGVLDGKNPEMAFWGDSKTPKWRIFGMLKPRNGGFLDGETPKWHFLDVKTPKGHFFLIVKAPKRPFFWW